MSSTAPPPPPPQKEAAFFTAIRSWGITRGPNAVFGGVAEGLGERIGMARIPARLIMVGAAFLFSGAALLAYGAAWALLPDRDGNIVIQNFGRGITNVGALIGMGIFAFIGLTTLDHGWWANGFGFSLGSHDVSGFGRFNGPVSAVFTLISVLFALALVGAGIYLVLHLVRRSQSDQTPPSSTPHVPQGDGDARQDSSSPASGSDESGPDPDTAADAVAQRSTRGAAVAPGHPEPWEQALLPGDRPVSFVPGATDASASSSAHSPGGGHPSFPPVSPPPYVRASYIPGPGRHFYLTTLAWLFISGAIILATERLDRLAVAPGLAWFALFTLGFGVILALVSVTGRKLGFLGFLSVPLLIAGMLTAINSGEVREAYQSAQNVIDSGPSDYWEGDIHYDGYGNVIDDGSGEVVDPTLADPTLAFADDYQQIYVAPQCYDWDAMAARDELYPDTGIAYDTAQEFSSQARMTYTSLKADSSVDVLAEHTILTIPKGTNLVLRADGNAQSTIDWESRGVYCEFWDGGQDNMSLINADAPTLTLVVRDDMYANTITVIETDPTPTTSPSPTAEGDTEDEPAATQDQPTKEEAKS